MHFNNTLKSRSVVGGYNRLWGWQAISPFRSYRTRGQSLLEAGHLWLHHAARS